MNQTINKISLWKRILLIAMAAMMIASASIGVIAATSDNKVEAADTVVWGIVGTGNIINTQKYEYPNLVFGGDSYIYRVEATAVETDSNHKFIGWYYGYAYNVFDIYNPSNKLISTDLQLDWNYLQYSMSIVPPLGDIMPWGDLPITAVFLPVAYTATLINAYKGPNTTTQYYGSAYQNIGEYIYFDARAILNISFDFNGYYDWYKKNPNGSWTKMWSSSSQIFGYKITNEDFIAGSVDIYVEAHTYGSPTGTNIPISVAFTTPDAGDVASLSCSHTTADVGDTIYITITYDRGSYPWAWFEYVAVSSGSDYWVIGTLIDDGSYPSTFEIGILIDAVAPAGYWHFWIGIMFSPTP